MEDHIKLCGIFIIFIIKIIKCVEVLNGAWKQNTNILELKKTRRDWGGKN